MSSNFTSSSDFWVKTSLRATGFNILKFSTVVPIFSGEKVEEVNAKDVYHIDC